MNYNLLYLQLLYAKAVRPMKRDFAWQTAKRFQKLTQAKVKNQYSIFKPQRKSNFYKTINSDLG